MIKIARNSIKVAIVIIIGILTFNIVYDVGVSHAVQDQKVSEERDITDLDKVKAIAAEEASQSSPRPEPIETESKTGKVVKYVSIVGILILAIAMLAILSNKEDIE